MLTGLLYGLMFFPYMFGGLQAAANAGQHFNSVAPELWYKGLFAGTGVKPTVYLVFGVFTWMFTYMFMVANIWAGKPWHLIKSKPWRGIVMVISIVLLSVLSMKVSMAIMNYVWGPIDPAAKDGIKSLAYRYFHVVNLSAFPIFPFLLWTHFFDNWPRDRYGAATGWVIRTVGTFVASTFLYIAYYKFFGRLFLGLDTVHQNKPVDWLLWYVLPLLFVEWFGNHWPFYKEEQAAVSSDAKFPELTSGPTPVKVLSN
ncbi:MAG: hypothetical protein ACYDGZ_12920 [Desulfosporosinus fructosivorans]